MKGPARQGLERTVGVGVAAHVAAPERCRTCCSTCSNACRRAGPDLRPRCRRTRASRLRPRHGSPASRHPPASGKARRSGRRGDRVATATVVHHGERGVDLARDVSRQPTSPHLRCDGIGERCLMGCPVFRVGADGVCHPWRPTRRRQSGRRPCSGSSELSATTTWRRQPTSPRSWRRPAPRSGPAPPTGQAAPTAAPTTRGSRPRLGRPAARAAGGGAEPDERAGSGAGTRPKSRGTGPGGSHACREGGFTSRGIRGGPHRRSNVAEPAGRRTGRCGRTRRGTGAAQIRALQGEPPSGSEAVRRGASRAFSDEHAG